MPHELDRLFRPQSVAVVGAGPNDPARMGTRTLHDLVQSGWSGEIFPVSTRHQALYGLRVWRSLRDLPASPDVVIARTPSAGIEALVDDATAVGAGFLVLLASGFAESGALRRRRCSSARAAAGCASSDRNPSASCTQPPGCRFRCRRSWSGLRCELVRWRC